MPRSLPCQGRILCFMFLRKTTESALHPEPQPWLPTSWCWSGTVRAHGTWRTISAAGRTRTWAQPGSRGRQALRDAGYEFDICFTSVQKRAIQTLWTVLDAIDQMWLPVVRTWRLNERHYGGLTGLNKAETAAKHGEAQVKIWRHSYDVPPPPMEPDHPFYSNISKDRRYADLTED